LTSISGEPAIGCTSLVRSHPVLPETGRLHRAHVFVHRCQRRGV